MGPGGVVDGARGSRDEAFRCCEGGRCPESALLWLENRTENSFSAIMLPRSDSDGMGSKTRSIHHTEEAGAQPGLCVAYPHETTTLTHRENGTSRRSGAYMISIL